MSPNNRQRLRTPQGTEGVFLDAAQRHRRLLRLVEDHFGAWDYHPVLTPVFDYFETYRPLLDHSQVERSYRFPDRDGELLMLRSDITLFLAKQMGVSLGGASLPRRVWYADSILRHQEEEDISSDEFFQAGAELIGSSGRDGDLEILMLLHDLLAAMDLPPWRLHIGSRAVLDAVLESAADAELAGELMDLRDRRALADLLARSGLDRGEERADLLLFLGTPGEFAGEPAERARSFSASAASAVDDLIGLAEILSRTAESDRVRIDLSEHGGQPYYTGFTVRAYVDGANSAIASGGRYDTLLGAFGDGAPAAGFSLMMRKIEPLSAVVAESPGDGSDTAVGEDFVERYRDAVAKRRCGRRVRLSGESGGRS